MWAISHSSLDLTVCTFLPGNFLEGYWILFLFQFEHQLSKCIKMGIKLWFDCTDRVIGAFKLDSSDVDTGMFAWTPIVLVTCTRGKHHVSNLYMWLFLGPRRMLCLFLLFPPFSPDAFALELPRKHPLLVEPKNIGSNSSRDLQL